MSKLETELIQLRVENDRLKALLATHGIAIPQQADATTSTDSAPQSSISTLSLDAKIKLFRRLFHGSDDVYPVRWESKKLVCLDIHRSVPTSAGKAFAKSRGSNVASAAIVYSLQ